MAGVEEYKVRLTAEDKASKVIEEADKKGKAFDKADYEATLDVDDKATKEIADADKKGEAFDGTIFSAKTDIENAKALQALRDIQDRAGDTTRRIESEDPKFDVDTTGAVKGMDEAKGAAISSVDSIRDVSGALGDAGGGALDASEGLLGLGETLAMINPRFEGLAATLGKAGLAFAVFSVATSVVDQLVGNAADAADAMDRVVSSFGQGQASVGDFVSALEKGRKQIGDFGTNIKNLTGIMKGEDIFKADAVEKFNDIMKESPAAAFNLLTSIQELGDQSGFSADQIEEMNSKVFDNIAATAGAEGAQKTYNQAVEDYTTLLDHGLAIRQRDGESVTDYAARLHEATQGYRDNEAAIEASQKATEAETKAHEDAAAAADEHRQALADLDNQLSSSVLSTAAVQSAQIKANQALRDYDKAMKDGSQSQEDHNLALNDMFTNLVNVATQTGDTAAAQSGLTLETDKAVLSSKTQIQYLEAVAETLGPNDPLRQLLANYIAELNKIPTKVQTDVDANTEQAMAKLRALQSYITSISGGFDIPIGLGDNFMAGTPYAPGGFARVGEAGPENVFLPRGARVDTAGRTAMADIHSGRGVVNHFVTLNVSVAPTANLAQAGREIAGALDAFYRTSGSRPRAAA